MMDWKNYNPEQAKAWTKIWGQFKALGYNSFPDTSPVDSVCKFILDSHNLKKENTMRYTDDGYISTEVELPPPGARVQYKYGDYLDGKPGRAIFDGESFVFDFPYKSFDSQPDDLLHSYLGHHYGYWRYLDTPDEEKRDSGQRSAFTEPSIEALEARIKQLEYVADLAIDADEMLLDRIEAIESRLVDSDKPSQLEKEGWISAEKEMPKDNYHPDYEVMKDGKNLGKAHAFTDRWTRRWTTWNPIFNIDIAGTYWRPLWKESTPENLATLKNGKEYQDKEIVEIKEKDGTVSKGFYSSGWHVVGKNCSLVDGIKGECRNISTQGTYFKRLD